MHPETLYPKTAQVLSVLKNIDLIQQFYLAGGTALALQLGHRRSIDLDFFISEFSDPENLLHAVGALRPKVIHQTPGTMDLLINDVKVSFIEYRYPLLEVKQVYDEVALASIRDIACMKVSAISSRGSKKDFVDLAVILEHVTLEHVLEDFAKKFESVQYETLHLLKSLVYFDDAEKDPDPDFLTGPSWEDTKKSIQDVVKRLNLKNLDQTTKNP